MKTSVRRVLLTATLTLLLAMKISKEELDANQIPHHLRNHCSNLLVDLQHCWRRHYYRNTPCETFKKAYSQCMKKEYDHRCSFCHRVAEFVGKRYSQEMRPFDRNRLVNSKRPRYPCSSPMIDPDLCDNYPDIPDDDLACLEQMNLGECTMVPTNINETAMLREKICQLEEDKINLAMRMNERIERLNGELCSSKTELLSQLAAAKLEASFAEQRLRMLEADNSLRSRKVPRGNDDVFLYERPSSLFDRPSKIVLTFGVDTAIETETETKTNQAGSDFSRDMHDLRAVIGGFAEFDGIETAGPMWSGLFHVARKTLILSAEACRDVLQALDVSLHYSVQHLKTYYCRFILYILYYLLKTRQDLCIKVFLEQDYSNWDVGLPNECKELIGGSCIPRKSCILRNIISAARSCHQFENKTISKYSLMNLEHILGQITHGFPVPEVCRHLFSTDGCGLIYFYKLDDDSDFFKSSIIRIILLLSEDPSYVELFFSPVTSALGESLHLLLHYDFVSTVTGTSIQRNNPAILEQILFLFSNWTLRNLVPSTALFSLDFVYVLPFVLACEQLPSGISAVIGEVLHELVCSRNLDPFELFGSSLLVFMSCLESSNGSSSGKFPIIKERLELSMSKLYSGVTTAPV